MVKYKYITGNYRGDRVFRCMDCEYDVLVNESTMVDHCRHTGHGTWEAPSVAHIEAEAEDKPLGVMITLGYLCWNTRRASVDGAIELVKERDRLKRMGCNAQVFIFDNGSEDGTYEAIREATADNETDILVHVEKNLGSSISRNLIIELALRNGSDYLLLLDGDIEVVPYSVYTMARYLECKPSVGCIGAYSSSFTTERAKADTVMTAICESRIKHHIWCAWTQYGLFRVSMFKRGVYFDSNGPFAVPGWGFEDDDLYWQIKEMGMDCQCFTGMTYLHRALHSSWDSIGKSEVRTQFQSRKTYLLEKWKARGLSLDILNIVAGQQFPGD